MKKILLGNEAIVQAALDAGVNFVSTYPGTPASEIGNEFSRLSRLQSNRGSAMPTKSASGPNDYNVYFEFSTNEKVALEAAIGASFSGLKCLVAMKNFGLNVCSDSLLPLAYTGTKGPMVIIAADDPSCWSSAQSEENSRPYAYLSHIPMLEPADPQECYDFVKLGFEISEKFNTPVILRTTTRVAHQRMPVGFKGKLASAKGFGVVKREFVKDFHRFVTMPPRVLEMKKELLEKIEKIQAFLEKSPINRIVGSPTSHKFGVVASGVAYLHVMEALQEMDLRLPVLKLGSFYPLPEKKIASFIKNIKQVLVTEELEGYLEKEINRLAKEANPKLKVFGKDLLPEIGELSTQKVKIALAKILKLKIANSLKIENCKLKIARRCPRSCQGCPHLLTFSILQKLSSKDIIFGGDIGCYMLAGSPPFKVQDYLSSMGSSIGIGHGIMKATTPAFAKAPAGKQKVIALIGDSTFFHAGIPALINCVYNKSNPLIIVLDNRTTAMTGHQPSPGSSIEIAEVAKACGVKNIKVIDPINLQEYEQTIKEFLNKDETSLIVARRICALLAKKNEKK